MQSSQSRLYHESTEDPKKLKDELFKERKKNLDLQRKIESFKKISGKKDQADNKVKKIKQDYKQLLEAFERSEKIRRD